MSHAPGLDVGPCPFRIAATDPCSKDAHVDAVGNPRADPIDHVRNRLANVMHAEPLVVVR